MTRSLAGAFAALRDAPGLTWLDRAGGPSFLAWEPAEVHAVGAGWPDALRRLGAGGELVAGYVGYEAGDVVAPVPPGRPTPEPPVWLARFPRWIESDAHGVRIVGDPAFRARAEALLSRPEPPPPLATGRAAASWPREAHADAVARIRELLFAGDCYQVNLTRVVHVRSAGDPADAWLRLRRRPASQGAFLRPTDRVAVLSNSPELLLRVRGAHVRSDPIKGTRPRADSAAEDARLGAELSTSRKDAAELVMIADLVRNDLHRVCDRVWTTGRELHAHPTVHHAHWPVEGELAAGRDGVDALAALFPPGSVTGAPKRRATERIRELEPEPRGVYCGAVGHTLRGDAEWSVAIRVAVFDGPDARYHVGGGIVVDSVAEDEWAETEAKGRALREALLAPPG